MSFYMRRANHLTEVAGRAAENRDKLRRTWPLHRTNVLPVYAARHRLLEGDCRSLPAPKGLCKLTRSPPLSCQCTKCPVGPPPLPSLRRYLARLTPFATPPSYAYMYQKRSNFHRSMSVALKKEPIAAAARNGHGSARSFRDEADMVHYGKEQKLKVWTLAFKSIKSRIASQNDCIEELRAH